ncbi:MAG: PIN domain protein, partial [Chloroflexi bacterium]|nr:PIN domain protein [Chloroflexota bacterium]
LTRFVAALDLPGAVLLELPLNRSVAVAMLTIDRAQVPDLPDRIIGATARRYGVPLLSRDARIRLAGLTIIW